MTKVLLKKQLMEVFSWLYQDKKNGKNRSKGGIIGFSVLYLVLFFFLGVIFYITAKQLCAPLCETGFGWLYFALMGLIAVALAVFGSVFNTFASLYQVKDNDLLLSMPIPTVKILIARLFGVYTIGLMYELIVMIPSLLVWFLNARITAAGTLFSLLVPFVLSIFVLTLSCILGYVVALFSSKLKRKNILTVFLSLVFLAAYYYVYSQAYKVLQSILQNPQRIGNSVKSILYPFYCMGRAAEGNVLSMLIFTAIMVLLFALVYLVLSHSFLKLATTDRGGAKAKYKERKITAVNADAALLRKELKRFLGSPNYMLNCGLGIVLMIIGAVALIIKTGDVRSVIGEMFTGYTQVILLSATAAVCMITSMCIITAPSVSLEGKSLWILQVLPVTAYQALKAKLKLHLRLTLPSAIILTAAVEFVLKPDLKFGLLMPVTVVMFVLFMALVGLCCNLMTPNLTWTNEIVPIKQGMSVMITLFGGWAAVVVFGLLYFAVRKLISPFAFLVIATGALAISSVALIHWMKTKGAEIFEKL